MVEVLSLAGVAVALLAGSAAGDATTGPAFGPAVGADAISKTGAAALTSVFVLVVGWTTGRRTLEALGNEIANLPPTAAILVAIGSSTIVVGRSAIGIPASFVIIATASIVGLGWERATRTATIPEVVRGEKPPAVSVGALAADDPGEAAPAVGDDEPADIPTAADPFDPATTGRVIVMQNVVLSTVGPPRPSSC